METNEALTSGTRRAGAACNAACNAHARWASLFFLALMSTRSKKRGKPGFQFRWKAQQTGADLKQ